MSSTLSILRHPNIEQIGEEWSPDGILFASVLRVRSRKKHTVITLRQLVKVELMQMICADFQQRRCSAFFLESDCEPSDDTIDQYLYDTAVRLNVSGRGEASVADQRESESYDGNCLHVHEGVISSAYGT